MSDKDFQWFDKNLDLEKVVNHYGWIRKSGKGSSKNSPKYSCGDTTIVIKKVNNTFWHVHGNQPGGSSVAFVQQHLFPNLTRGGWSKDITKKIFDELHMLAGISNDFIVKESITPKRFNTNKRKKIESFFSCYTKPALDHPYLVEERKIDPEYLKQKKFHSCIRVVKNPRIHDDVLFFQKDQKGVCAYEKQNSRPFGNIKFFNENCKKAMWYTDDLFDCSLERVFIGEAAIDALSAGSLAQQDMALMSACGGFDKRIYLDKNKSQLNTKNEHVKNLIWIFEKVKAKEIMLGNDNDAAGKDYDDFYFDFFNEYFPNKFKVTVEKAPMALNDWNNYLAVVCMQNKTKFLDLAKSINELVIAEGGVNKFRLIPSQVNPNAAIMVLPPAGFTSSNLNAIAEGFLYTMRKFNEHAVVSYAPNLRGSYSHAKEIELWRREYLPALEYKKIKGDPILYLKSKNRLSDPTVANDWSGFTESIKHPHKLAAYTSELIITKSHDDKVRYYHSSYPPMNVILAVPSPEAQMANKSLDKDIMFDAKGFINSFAKNAIENKKIRFSPALQANNKMTISHCAFIKDQILNNEKQFQGVELITDHPVKGFNNVLDVLVNKDLLVSENYLKSKPKNIVSIDNAKKKPIINQNSQHNPSISR